MSASGTSLTTEHVPSAHRLLSTDAEWEVRRAEQEADPLVALPAGEVERGVDAVHGHEAELADGRRVPGACDEHRAEAAERRLARVPVAEGEERVHGPAGAVVADRARVGGRRTLGVRDQLRVAAHPHRVEERPV